MKRLIFAGGGRTRTIASISACILAMTGCGGGGGSDSAKVVSVPEANVPASAAAVVDSAAKPIATASTVPAVVAAPVAATVANSTAPAVSANATLAPLQEFSFYKLRAANNVGAATLSGGTLSMEGNQYPAANLVAGKCTIGGTAFSQCASAPTQNVFTLCSSDNGAGPGSDKVRSRYVLFDPKAERVTDVAALKNLKFDGYENCGQDNVGSQVKGAPSSTLMFDRDGNLTLMRFDRNPARVDAAPASLVNLNSDTVNGGNTARFTLYRNNGRYILIATTAPTSGATATDPGTLTAFVQQ